MGNMKANKKFVEGEEAVSAVIGVILMVAITVAIAATVYVYVSGMVTPETTGKTMSAIQSGSVSGYNVTYKVTDTDAGITWGDVTPSWEGASGVSSSNISGVTTTSNIAVGDYFTIDVGASGTYIIDLIYGGSIIWTSPAVAV